MVKLIQIKNELGRILDILRLLETLPGGSLPFATLQVVWNKQPARARSIAEYLAEL